MSISQSTRIVPLILLLLIGFSETALAKKIGGNFELTDADNRSFQLDQLQGEVVVLFFGYTSCPDVCPAELGKVAQILKAFEKDSAPVKGLFISVDPDRDSPEVLKQYTSYFSKQLMGLTGTREQIDLVTDNYRANYRIDKDDQNRITVDHTGNLYVIDRFGELNTVVPSGMDVAHVIQLVRRLL